MNKLQRKIKRLTEMTKAAAHMFGMEEGKVYYNNKDEKIEIIKMEKDHITYSINDTTTWRTDYDRFLDIISR